MKRWMLTSAAPLVLGACTMGPDYQRPPLETPEDFRFSMTPATAESLGDMNWWTLFPDEELQKLIRTALTGNYDVQIAAARILEARAQLAITGSVQSPTVNAVASSQYTSIDGDRPSLAPRESFSPLGALDFLFEVDLWGRLRRATEASRAELLATEEAKRFVVITLVSDVASAYFALRSLDQELDVSRGTLESRRRSLELVTQRQVGAVAAQIDVHQAEILVATAAQTVADTERQIGQLENFISVLVGHNPDAIPRGRALEQQVSAPQVPVGLPSWLLERRADVRVAEEQLVAATARIGVARADWFPRLDISATAAVQGLYTHPSQVNDDGTRDKNSFGPSWLFAGTPIATLPLFNAGRISAGVDFAEARAQEAALQYRQVVLGAFRDVSDALIEIEKRKESRIDQEALALAARETARLSNIRYTGGVTSYLEVLDSERQLFDAELGLVRTKRDELLAVVRLYKALGGGWQPEPQPEGEAQAPS